MNNKPKLRFKEFNNNWEEKKVKDFGYISMCKRIFREQTSTKDDIPFYKIGTFGKEPDAFISRELFQEYKEKYPYPKTGNILISASGTIGRTVEYNGEDAYYQDSNIIWINHNDLIIDKFLNVIIQNINWDKVIEGSTIKRLYNNNLLELKISLPCLEEQQKIAEFLSKVDEVIAEREAEVKDLEQKKKGLMQKLFSQQLRFTDSNNQPYPEWKETKLGKICSIQMGQSPDSNSYNDKGVGAPLIQGNADMKNRKSSPQRYTSEITKLCEIGDIIMTVRAPVGYVGVSLHKACIGRGVCSIKSNENIMFIYHTLVSKENVWRKLEQGSTFTAVNGNDIKALPVKTPCLEEQEKIANVLSKLDELIEEKKALLFDWQQFKKGLLQQMFV